MIGAPFDRRGYATRAPARKGPGAGVAAGGLEEGAEESLLDEDGVAIIIHMNPDA